MMDWKVFDPVVWEKYGLAGLFGLALFILFFYLLRLVPRLFRQFRDELALEREHNSEQMALERKHCAEGTDKVLTLLLAFQNRNDAQHTRTHDLLLRPPAPSKP